MFLKRDPHTDQPEVLPSVETNPCAFSLLKDNVKGKTVFFVHQPRFNFSETQGQGVGVRGEVKQDLLEINLQIVCFRNWLHFTFKRQEL